MTVDKKNEKAEPKNLKELLEKYTGIIKQKEGLNAVQYLRKYSR